MSSERFLARRAATGRAAHTPSSHPTQHRHAADDAAARVDEPPRRASTRSPAPHAKPSVLQRTRFDPATSALPPAPQHRHTPIRDRAGMTSPSRARNTPRARAVYTDADGQDDPALRHQHVRRRRRSRTSVGRPHERRRPARTRLLSPGEAGVRTSASGARADRPKRASPRRRRDDRIHAKSERAGASSGAFEAGCETR